MIVGLLHAAIEEMKHCELQDHQNNRCLEIMTSCQYCGMDGHVAEAPWQKPEYTEIDDLRVLTRLREKQTKMIAC